MSIAIFPRSGQEANFERFSQIRLLTRRALIACPLAVTGVAAIYSRNHTDDHQVPCATPAYDMQVLAYAPYVKSVKLLFKADQTQANREKLLALARSWDNDVKQDKLVPLAPVSFEDSIEEGARGSILRAKSRLVAFLTEDAHQLASEGKVREAADEALLALRLTESLKYGDFNTVYAATIEEKKITEFLRRRAPKMDAETRAAVRGALTQVAARSSELDDLTRASRVQYYDWMMRMSKEPVTIEDVHRTAFVSKRIVSDPESRDTLQYLRSAITYKAADTGPEYLTELRLAWRAERTNQRHLKSLIESL